MLLSLRGFGRPSTPATVVVRALGPIDRLRRGGAILGAGLGAALVTLPIPLVHLFVPPAGLLLGLVFGVRRMTQREIFQSAEAACPFCHSSQRLGLAGSAFRLPRNVTCSSCLQPLSLEANLT